MAIKVVNDGELFLLDILHDVLNNTRPMACHLYKNDHTPADTDDVNDYTEADFAGYSEQFAVPFGDVFLDSGRARMVGPTLQFTSTDGTPQDIYGIFVTQDVGLSELVYAERFNAAPVSIGVLTLPIFVTPSISLRSEN